MKKWSFHERVEIIQYDPTFSINEVIKGTSKDKLYQELNFESSHKQRFPGLCIFYEIYEIYLREVDVIKQGILASFPFYIYF